MLDASELDDVPGEVSADMRRFSVVLAVAALDTYMHRLIVDRAFDHSRLPNKLADTPIPFHRHLAEVEASAVAARSTPFNSRPRTRAKTALRNQLLNRTFQAPKEVDEALGMAGLSGNWKEMGEQLQMTKKQVEGRLSGIVMRRNQIVHEGDYERLDRPQKANMNSLTQAQAASDIDFLARLVAVIDSVT